ncbi:MAG: alanine/ornithine racemase family PLP-dependent enzyme [Firmicutes bacterium]|nr:alanine/ornithine racemase family PLP-dependent enzyme [Bacillota bacterium]
MEGYTSYKNDTLCSGTHLTADLDKIRYNAAKTAELCRAHGIAPVAVTKGFAADPAIVRAIVDGGIEKLADARVENVRKLREAGFDNHMTLIRIPMLSQADEVVSLCECSLVSELRTMEALSEAALKQGKTHEVVLMIDVGDLREGVFPEEAPALMEAAMELPGICVAGVGSNVGCYGGVVPSEENIKALCDTAEELSSIAGHPLETVSGGATSALTMMAAGSLPKAVNQLRVGEGIILGTDSVNGIDIPWLKGDAFILRAEIIELSSKPTVPIGKRGSFHFGEKKEFTDRGIRRRAIVALGEQDVPASGVMPVDPDITILGASSDHMILDVEDSAGSFEVGGLIDLRLDYHGLLGAFTSGYIPKVYL